MTASIISNSLGSIMSILAGVMNSFYLVCKNICSTLILEVPDLIYALLMGMYNLLFEISKFCIIFVSSAFHAIFLAAAVLISAIIEFSILVFSAIFFLMECLPFTLLDILYEIIAYSSLAFHYIVECMNMIEMTKDKLFTFMNLSERSQNIFLSICLGFAVAIILHKRKTIIKLLKTLNSTLIFVTAMSLVISQMICRHVFSTFKRFFSTFKRFFSTLSSFCYRKQNQQSAKLSISEEESTHALINELNQQKEQNLCVVCQAKSRNIISLPCRHFCMCSVCSAKIMATTKVCPVCRGHINESLSVYM